MQKLRRNVFYTFFIIFFLLSGNSLPQKGQILAHAAPHLAASRTPWLGGEVLAQKNNSKEISTEFMQFYNAMDYRGCANFFQEHSDKVLNAFALEIYAECLFQLKKLGESAALLKTIVLQHPDSRQRAFSRLLDIYKLNGGRDTVQDIVDYLRKNPEEESFIQRIQPTLIDLSLIKEFVEMYKISPINILTNQWNLIISAAEEQDFKFLVDSIRYPGHYRTTLYARFYFAHKQFAKAEELLLAHLRQGENLETRNLLADIYWSQNKKEEAIAQIFHLKSYGSSGYRLIAQFFFDRGILTNAHSVVDEALGKNYPLYDLKIFYTMAEGKHAEAAFLLEVYNEQRKITMYDYNRLMVDFNHQGTDQDHYRGLLRAQQQFPHLCQKSIEKMLSWAPNEEVITAVEQCSALRQSHQMQNFLFNLESRRKFDLIIALLNKKVELLKKEAEQPNATKKNLSEGESFLLAKSIIESESPQTDYAAELLQGIENNAASYLKHEAALYLARANLLQQKFDEAFERLKKIQHLDKTNLRLLSLLYAGRFEEFSQLANSPSTYFFSGNKEANFFKSAYHLSQKQQSQAVALLEKYLDDPGSYGNQAVYLLFLLKYFPAMPDIEEFCLDLIAYPIRRNKAYLPFDQELHKLLDFKFFGNKDYTITEFEVFKFVWAIRANLQESHLAKYKQYLQKLSGQENALLLEAEINFLIAQIEIRQNSRLGDESKKNFLLKFPDSPLKLLLKP